MYYDAHTHLNADKLYPDRQQYLQNFIDAGGHGLINIGVNDERNMRAIEIAQTNHELHGDSFFMKAAIGIHPGEVSYGHITSKIDITKEIEKLKRLHDTHHQHIVAIGECGIDAHYEGYKQGKGLQQALFYAQAELARERQLPIVIHSRDQFSDSLEVIQEFSDLKVYFHCRGYTPEDVEKLHETCPNVRIGFCGNTTYPKAQQLRDSLNFVASQAPLIKGESFTKGNRGIGKTSSHDINFLLETDAPYLSPQQKRGTTNEPAHLPFLYDTVSEYLSLELSDLQQLMKENFFSLYGS